MRGEETDETRALAALQEPRFATPLPWSDWSLPPRALLEILTAVQRFDAPVIVDCGSGVSTLYLARAVRAIGRGQVVALEQDAAWGASVTRLLEQNDLQAWGRVVVVPLQDLTVCGRSSPWYAPPADLLPSDSRVDIVVVDGPVGRDGVLVRLAALPHFWDRLSDRAVVFLDDTLRPEEQEICRLWREQFPVTEAKLGTEHGMSKFTRRTR